MVSWKFRPRRLRQGPLLLASAAAILVAALGAPADGLAADIDVLRVGTTGTLTGKADAPKEQASLEALHSFIKDETGLENEVVAQKKWRELADKLATKQLHLGVFQGYEFAWAQEKYADLKPLAVAVNVNRYCAACLMTRRDAAATDFASLQGQSLCIPTTNQGCLRLFVKRQADAAGKKMEDFFSKITDADNVEDALDDVIDGNVEVVLVERAALDAYKRRKPGRFNQLKEVVHSQPFPPTIVAYYGSVLDEATLNRFKEGLLGAAAKPKGETLLTLAHLTGFEAVPEDLGSVLAETRKAYPPPEAKTK